MEASPVLREKEVGLELTKEKYLQHKQEGWNDSQIRKQYGFKFPNDLTNWKKKHGLDGYRLSVQSEPACGSTVEVKEQETASEQETPAKRFAKTPLQQFRNRAIDLLQTGKATVESKEEAFRLVNVLEAMDLGWQIGGKAGQYWVSSIEL